jgi:nicotinate-nucleotide pyrophosphorylase (carboxylating)
MNALTLPDDIATVVKAALAEDVGGGDLTADLIPSTTSARAHVVVREHATLCGTAWFDEVFRQIDSRIDVRWNYADGAQLQPETVICEVTGPARSIVTGERTALNFLQTLSGTATAAHELATIVAGTGTRVLDTRKTLPLLRRAQKYAVRCGGATNHRIGLFDAVLIKENHIAAVGSLSTAVAAARRAHPDVMIEVEVENLEQLDEALETSVDRIMLDDFTLPQIREAVQRRNAHPGKRKELEISGGVSPETLRAYAETGVDFISVGGMTKHVRAVDFSMRFV